MGSICEALTITMRVMWCDEFMETEI